MSRKYVLDGRTPVPVADILDPRIRVLWDEPERRRVASDVVVVGGIVSTISTVFLVIDHNTDPAGQPLLFETMVFGGEHDEEQWRYSTWGAAEEGHRTVVRLVQEGQRAVGQQPAFSATEEAE